MSNYSRFVSYLYEYKNGTKSENRGFVKIESRDDVVKMEVHIKSSSQPANLPLTIYGFVKEGGRLPGILLGNCYSGKGSTSHKMRFPTQNIENTGYHFQDLSGFLIFCENSVCYGTSWNDNPIKVDQFYALPSTASDEMAMAPEEQRAESASSTVDADDAYETMLLPEDDYSAVEAAGSSEQEQTPAHTEEVTVEEITEEVAVEEITEEVLKADNDDSSIEDLTVHKTEQSQAYANPYIGGAPKYQGNAYIAGHDPYQANEYFAGANPYQSSPQEQNVLSGTYAQSDNSYQNNISSQENAPSSTNEYGQDNTPYPASEYGQDNTPYPANEYGQDNAPYSANEYGQDNAPYSASEYGQDNAPYSTNEYGQDNTPSYTNEYGQDNTPSYTNEYGQDNTSSSVNGYTQENAPYSANQYGQDYTYYSTGGYEQENAPYSAYDYSYDSSYQPGYNPGNDIYTAADYGQYPYENANQSQMYSYNSSGNADNGQIEAASADTLYQTHSQTTSQDERWIQLQRDYSSIDAFPDDEIIECIRLEQDDLPNLRKNQWLIGNNQFILHALTNYEHLIMGRMNTTDGTVYILGVPGLYDPKEKFMANMFGFPYFKQCADRGLQPQNFGYWYRSID